MSSPTGAGGHLAPHLEPVAVGLVDELEQAAPVAAGGLAGPLQGGDRQRPAGDLGHGPQQAELGVDVVEVGDGLEDALADGAHGPGDAEQLVGPCGEAGRHAAVGGLVGDGARRGEAEGAGLDALGHQAAHLGDLVGGGGFGVVGAAVAHHVAAQGAMGHLGAHVDGLGRRGEGVEVLGEALPLPADALVQGGAGDVLDALHERHQPLVAVGAHGGEAHPAVAHDHGGDPVPRRGADRGVPGGLTVVVGVDVDPAGGDDEPVGVELLPAAALDPAHLGDASVGHGHVALPARRPRAVDDGPAPDHQIVLGHVPLLVPVAAGVRCEADGTAGGPAGAPPQRGRAVVGRTGAGRTGPGGPGAAGGPHGHRAGRWPAPSDGSRVSRAGRWRRSRRPPAAPGSGAGPRRRRSSRGRRGR